MTEKEIAEMMLKYGAYKLDIEVEKQEEVLCKALRAFLSEENKETDMDIKIREMTARDGEKSSFDMSQEEFGTLCICALRYCHGRKTYMPEWVQSIVRQHLKELSDKDLGVMIEDCNMQRAFDLYGDQVDREDWLKWEQSLLEERERRNQNA